MGVYHLMGLGRSVGVITGPISYLAHRYQRWNTDDQVFFARSGEVRQRQKNQKVGDIQALVLFTTPEILSGGLLCLDYIDNPDGRVTEVPQKKGGATKEILGQMLKRRWPSIVGGRESGDVFWCEIDRRDIQMTYNRIIQIVAALSSSGGQGHEMWINLTGGNNVINLALELAANLSGEVARLYYIQAETGAEKCTRFTAENGYWVELPVMPLALGRLTLAILDLLTHKAMTSEELYSRAHTEYWDLMHGISSQEAFMEAYLRPMWKQGLIAESEASYVMGPQWALIQPYQERLQIAQRTQRSLEQLAQQESWITRETLNLTR
ncbi:MAG: hypothetical protein JXA33_03185 [Anaerolineae bacterium]|nr:hypothetical protein [Anaerolineae bacterium]